MLGLLVPQDTLIVCPLHPPLEQLVGAFVPPRLKHLVDSDRLVANRLLARFLLLGALGGDQAVEAGHCAHRRRVPVQRAARVNAVDAHPIVHGERREPQILAVCSRVSPLVVADRVHVFLRIAVVAHRRARHAAPRAAQSQGGRDARGGGLGLPGDLVLRIRLRPNPPVAVPSVTEQAHVQHHVHGLFLERLRHVNDREDSVPGFIVREPVV